MRLGLGIGLTTQHARQIGGGGASYEVHGAAQGMRAVPQGKNGGANINTTAYTRHVFPVTFNRIKLIFSVFESIGTPIADVLHSGSTAIFSIQYGFQYPFNGAVTSLSPRTPFTFLGKTQNYYTFNASTHDANYGYVETDWLSCGLIPAGQPFQLMGTVELPAGSYNNALPYMINATNNIDRWVGQSFSGSSRIAALGGASDFALNSTSITKLGTTQAGVSGIYTPAMALIETPLGTRCIVPFGDSLGFGNNEGQAGSSTFGDAMGNLNGSIGFVDRSIENEGLLMGVNISKGSDGYKYWKTAANWKYRRQLALLANPTHIVAQGGVNDVTPTLTVNGWVANTVYSQYAIASANSNIYMCEVGGTSAASGGPSGTGSAIADNTVTWSHVMALPGTASPRGAALIYADMCQVHDLIMSLLPSVKIVKTAVTPNSTSTDSWVTDTNQTAATNWGDNTSRRALLNGLFSSKQTRMKIAQIADPNTVLEFSYPTVTSKWVVNGVANYATQDGTHHNSKGADLAKGTLTGKLN